MTDGEQTALGWTLATIVGPLILALILGLMAEQQLAIRLALASLVATGVWSLIWIGYVGGRLAQQRRDWKK